MGRHPDEKACRELMTRTSMLPNIMEHSYRVCQLAGFLGRELNHTGTELDLTLIRAAALLHDITKTRCLKTKENHAETAGTFLLELGFPEAADVVSRHVRFQPGEVELPFNEAHIVNYADKRVLHDRVVTLAHRFDDLRVRYAKTSKAEARIERMRQEIFRLEERMFSRLGFAPERLADFNATDAFDLDASPPGRDP